MTKKDLENQFLDYFNNLETSKFSVKSFERIFGGASRETYKVLLAGDNNEERNLIYRRTQDSSLIETEQSTEYSAYSAFQNSPVPVPKIIALEEDSNKLGAPFILMEEIPGKAASPFDKEAYVPHKIDLGNQFWEILGNIVKKDISDPILKDFYQEDQKPVWKRELDKWVDVIRQDSIGEEPILEAAIRSLEKTPPNETENLCMVHGDYRNGNFLYLDNKITGILDWEMAHFGDPLEDLAWALSPIWSWTDHSRPAYLIDRDDALEIWKKTSGLALNKKDLEWWELFSCVKGLAIWISAGNEFNTFKNPDPINLFSAWLPGDIHTEIILEKLSKGFQQ